MSKNLFDIIICVGPYDCNIIHDMIPYTKKNVIGYRNIYIICSDPSLTIEGTITINENIFPFCITDLISQFGNNNRNGWYLQQLLKLYAGNVIPGILKNYLIIDGDTFFLKPTSFIDVYDRYIYTTGNEHHLPYFKHMNKLHPLLKKLHECSGISHHMIMNSDIVNSLFKLVETEHDNSPFWKIFLNSIDIEDFPYSGASEYEMYFNYVIKFHNDKITIRQLEWCNAGELNDKNNQCDFISIHWYIRL